jgi:hypothetical protein
LDLNTLNILTKISATRFTGSPNPSGIGASRYAPRLTNIIPNNNDINIDDPNADTNNDDSTNESDDDKKRDLCVKAIRDAVKKAVKKANKKNKPANSDSKVAKPDLYYRERDKFEA